MDNLLVMVPTRGRPQRLKDMLDSYQRTKSINTDIFVYLNQDDNLLNEYKEMLSKHEANAIVEVGPRRYLAEAYNYIFKKHGNYKYYSPLNDDHFCTTLFWDKDLINIVEDQGKGWGMACADDWFTNWKNYQHPSGCVLSGNIPRTLGYFIWPKIQHVGIDAWFMRVLQGINRLYHTKDVVIEHRHWYAGKALLDANYKFVYSTDQFTYGMNMVREYMLTQYEADIAKLKKEMEK